jgi:hypothetical protein
MNPQIFSINDFHSLRFKLDRSICVGQTQLNQHAYILSKLIDLDSDLWRLWGYNNFKRKKFAVLGKKMKCARTSLWFAYYDFDDLADHVNLNFSIEKNGFYIDINAELKKSFRRLIENIKKNTPQFNSLINNIKFYITTILWTKLPLMPENINDNYWKEIFNICKAEIDGKNILNKVDQIIQNFDKYKEEMIFEVENNPRCSPDATNYVKKTYNGRKMNPWSRCVIRIRHFIDKDEALKMNRRNFVDYTIDISKEFKRIIDFANT